MATTNHKKSYMVNRKDEFIEYIKPWLEENLSGTWHSVEGTGNMESIDTLNQFFDLYCGIDVFYMNTKKQLFPFAIRIQKYKNMDWGTFTIRCARDNSNAKVEYTELVDSIEANSLRPRFHLQAYLDDNNNIISIYICKTKSIIDFINDGHATMKHTGNSQNGQASFYVCKVDDLIEQGYKVTVHKPKREIILDNAEDTYGCINPEIDKMMKGKTN